MRKNTRKQVAPLRRISPQMTQARAYRKRRLARYAFMRSFGYDPVAALKFVLTKVRWRRTPVLDIGTGKGDFAVALARRFDAVTTLDINIGDRRFARLAAIYAGVADRIRFVVGDGAKLPWRRPRFGLVASMNAFHHMEYPDRVFAEMCRVLLPGGILVLADFDKSGFQIMDDMCRTEGETHPHPPSRFAVWKASLTRQGYRVELFRDCHLQVLIAISPEKIARS